MHGQAPRQAPAGDPADGAVIGIVSRADVVRTLFDSLQQPEGGADDAANPKTDRQGVRPAAISAARRAITIAVTGGAVELDGVVFDLRQRDAAQVVAENVRRGNIGRKPPRSGRPQQRHDRTGSRDGKCIGRHKPKWIKVFWFFFSKKNS